MKECDTEIDTHRDRTTMVDVKAIKGFFIRSLIHLRRLQCCSKELTVRDCAAAVCIESGKEIRELEREEGEGGGEVRERKMIDEERESVCVCVCVS